jgi:hypothetical protein
MKSTWSARRLATRALCLGLVTAAFASSAAAAGAMTVRIGTPNLSARVLVEVPLFVTCSPFDASLTLFQESVSVSVEQAAGKAIAQGTAFRTPPPGSLLFPCDGAEHELSVSVLANPAGAPFHGGAAVVSASAGAVAGIPCFPGSTTCFLGTASQSASVGPLPVRMH